ncbi:MAG: endonuclease domain-containing protein [Christensenellales bacterium]
MKPEIRKNNKLLPTARQLRQEMTPQERKLWYLFLRDYSVKVYKQRIIGSFIVDFYCHAAKLAIELDGMQHYTEQGLAYDMERSAFLAGRGITVLRFTNKEIDQDFCTVCKTIGHTIQERMRLPADDSLH